MKLPTISTSAATGLEGFMDGNYGLEVLCANWTPMAVTLSEPVTRACEVLAGATSADIDTFLARFYHSQRS